MSKSCNLILVLVCVWAWALTSAHAQQVSDMILYNGKIITVDDHSFTSRLGTIAQAMHVQNGKILHIGNNSQIRAMAGPNTKVIDLKGRTVIPGLIDTHEHPYDWAPLGINALRKYLPDDIILRTFENGPQETAKELPGVLKEAVSKAKPGQWIYLVVTSGKNFEFHGASNGSLGRTLIDPSLQVPLEKQITKAQLDEWAPNNPVYVHGWLAESGVNGQGVNQKAIEEINKVFPDPATNVFAPGPDSVRSTSPCCDASGTGRWIATDVMLKDHYPQLVQIQKSSLEWWAGFGMTAFSGGAYTPSAIKVYRDLDSKGEMPIRYMWTWLWNPEYLYADPFFLNDIASRTGEGSDHLWFGGGSVTWGAMCTIAEPLPTSKALQYNQAQAQARGQVYGNPCHYDPGSRNAEVAEKFIRAGGRFVNLHTSGDRDMDNILRMVEKASKEAGMTDDDIRAKRHGMDHGVQWPRADQIPLLKRMGILASGDPLEIFGSSPTAFDMYGEKGAEWVVPKKSLFQAGIYSSIEVDRPLETQSNFTIFRASVAPMIERKGWDGKVYAANEAVDRETALKIATYQGAYYLLRENVLGSLEPGKWADFAVLDRDYLTIPADDIKNTRVLMTVVGGESRPLSSLCGARNRDATGGIASDSRRTSSPVVRSLLEGLKPR